MAGNELICEDSFEIGNILANKFEVKIYGLTEDVSDFWIRLANVAGSGPTAHEETWFTGIVDSSKTDNKNLDRNIVAYDYSYYIRELDVTTWWTNFWTNHPSGATLKTLREDLCTYAGFIIAPNAPTLVNDTASFGSTYVVPTADSWIFKDVLRMICEMQGCCPNVNRAGHIEFIPLTNIAQGNATDVSDTYARNDTVFEDYTLDVNGVKVLDNSSNAVVIIQPVSGTACSYLIKNNLFLLAQTVARARSLVRSVLTTYLQNVTYVPTELHMIISDYNIKLGNLLTLQAPMRTGTNTYHLVLNQTFSGPQLVDQTIESITTGDNLKYDVVILTPVFS